ncbi:TIM barrel protein [Ponticoccus sp. SC2-23]|uniref:TIM barrel protein n=1 Tax=Alexandriicola marinus TaxID=2081710 RepID=UPI000FDA73EE|nr:TIM barrel protein [Alexandriicola marinus]MBM1219069.1 TIM barrel protein [Ponticoccus sp. SC6-9]MBM1223859.1 TIM barrel protein [Ponticoccus sp. SC6-15]MBM1228883.1 TIM barrel protein [Ponticoccus sp. SC6-38]MBM1232825.1 TIM barrel protein [Ponticoccus sp. SC6-45]MBM1237225.1 TIM barrel protein [Ponticoccus sp. SC6-49]MBM1241836.1 TIM barrel protein [Ponticoccus sp. SC2-64]MBM1246349.1 TIM barrel protein [Ponticoccus sp. SC6-42]MBM1250827.1 TIM barrel protein [Ponticoccus sp. SC6-33]M
MLRFAINHMTVPRARFDGLLDMAADLDCIGVEFRNDLPGALFDGADPAEVGQAAADRGLRILALAEVKSFNIWSDDKAREAEALMQIATSCGAEAIALIPRNDGGGRGNGERQANLRVALRELGPMLAQYDLMGLVEPLGFEISSLRLKSEAVDAITALGHADRFRLVHDTFHHHLAGETEVFPEMTGIVHISGVKDPTLSVGEMTDAHRIHVDARDRLGNIEQISTLIRGGYEGPISVEAFAPAVHESADPAGELAGSFEFIRDQIAAEVA